VESVSNFGPWYHNETSKKLVSYIFMYTNIQKNGILNDYFFIMDDLIKLHGALSNSRAPQYR
jgi:hypothetical protein